MTIVWNGSKHRCYLNNGRTNLLFVWFFFSEIARDEFLEQPGYEVIGGIISPVHDSYKKPDLVNGLHRCAMVKISLQTSDWIRLSDWECNEQTDWTRTRTSLQYHQVSYYNHPISIENVANENFIFRTISIRF